MWQIINNLEKFMSYNEAIALVQNDRNVKNAVEMLLKMVRRGDAAPETRSLLGLCYQLLGDYGMSGMWYLSAVEAGGDGDTYGNICQLLTKNGDNVLSSAVGAMGFASGFDSPILLQNYIMALSYWADWGTVEREAIRLCGFVYPGAGLPPPLKFPSTMMGTIRIGFIGGDFRNHAVMRWFIPLLRGMRGQNAEAYIYSNASPADHDDWTRVIKAHSDKWKDVLTMDDADVCTEIRKDNVDVLVDLSGQTGLNRLGVLSRWPAGVQVSMLGSPVPTGLSGVYRLSDHWCDPGVLSYGSLVIRLPSGFNCFLKPDYVPIEKECPMRKNGFVTFGAYAGPPKITDATLRWWAKAISAKDKSLLVFKGPGFEDEAVRAKMRVRCAMNGINRVGFRDQTDTEAEHLNTFNMVDILLDTTPYNGTTTTAEALWMGVPVLTIIGDDPRSRVSHSILSRVSEGIPQTSLDSDSQVEEFVEQVNPEWLEHIRGNLRPDVGKNLCDYKKYGQEFVAALRRIL